MTEQGAVQTELLVVLSTSTPTTLRWRPSREEVLLSARSQGYTNPSPLRPRLGVAEGSPDLSEQTILDEDAVFTR